MKCVGSCLPGSYVVCGELHAQVDSFSAEDPHIAKSVFRRISCFLLIFPFRRGLSSLHVSLRAHTLYFKLGLRATCVCVIDIYTTW